MFVDVLIWLLLKDLFVFVVLGLMSFVDGDWIWLCGL